MDFQHVASEMCHFCHGTPRSLALLPLRSRRQVATRSTSPGAPDGVARGEAELLLAERVQLTLGADVFEAIFEAIFGWRSPDHQAS